MQLVQGKYTIAKEIHENPIHVQVIRGPFTRSIGALIPDVADEVAAAIEDAIPKTEDGKSLFFFHPANLIACLRRLGQRRCIAGDDSCRLPREQQSIHRPSIMYVLSTAIVSLA